MKTPNPKFLLVLLLIVMSLLACRLPLLPGRVTETPTPEPEPTFLPTTTTAPEPTPTKKANAVATSENGGNEKETGEEPAGETSEDFPLDYEYDEDVLQPPMENWGGLPVMPGAVGGYDSPGSYAYFVDASLDEVDSFYEAALTEAGFSLFITVIDDEESLMDMYIQADKMVSIAALRPEGESLTMIILVSD